MALIHRFLKEILPDPKTRENLIKSLKQIYHGKGERKILVFKGKFSNSGKFILVEIIKEAFGPSFDHNWLGPFTNLVPLLDAKIVYPHEAWKGTPHFSDMLEALMKDEPIIDKGRLYQSVRISTPTFSAILTAYTDFHLPEKLSQMTTIVDLPVELPHSDFYKRYSGLLGRQLLRLLYFPTLQQFCVKALRNKSSSENVPPHLQEIIETQTIPSNWHFRS